MLKPWRGWTCRLFTLGLSGLIIAGLPGDRLQAADGKPSPMAAGTGLPAAQVRVIRQIPDRLAALGRKLFFDPRLSKNGDTACATCHRADQGFTETDRATARGLDGKPLRRSAPTVFNVAFMESLFADGRAEDLESQALQPLVDAREMGNGSLDEVIARLRRLPDYHGRFENVFGRPVDADGLAAAIAGFERRLIAADSPFDRWYLGSDEKALIPAAKRGFELFRGKGQCSTCHLVFDDYALFIDNRFHNTGLAWKNAQAAMKAGRQPDYGRAEVTGRASDRFKFKTPTLRNIAATAPYMHDGSMASLADVVRFYNNGGVANPTRDPLIRPLSMSEAEIADLVAFLESLTSPQVARWRQIK